MVIDPLSQVVAALDDKPDQVLVAELHKATVTKARMLYPFLRDRRPETYTHVASPLLRSASRPNSTGPGG